jgi:hypothetical protein
MFRGFDHLDTVFHLVLGPLRPYFGPILCGFLHRALHRRRLLSSAWVHLPPPITLSTSYPTIRAATNHKILIIRDPGVPANTIRWFISGPRLPSSTPATRAQVPRYPSDVENRLLGITNHLKTGHRYPPEGKNRDYTGPKEPSAAH